jgi:hypothetical protein
MTRSCLFEHTLFPELDLGGRGWWLCSRPALRSCLFEHTLSSIALVSAAPGGSLVDAPRLLEHRG